MKRILRALIVAMLATALLGGCNSQGPAQPGVTYERYTFSCCLASEVGPMWHSGQTVELHWIVGSAAATSDNQPHRVVLTAVLAGPYRDVATLKAKAPAPRTIPAGGINTDDRTPTVPVSVFRLPSDLAPGFYNLTITVDFGSGNSMDSGSVVQVGP